MPLMSFPFARLLVLISVFCSFAGSLHAADESGGVDFNQDVRPILSNRCLVCHGPDDARREAGLRLDDAGIATRPLDSGSTAVVPGNPDNSELIRRITSDDESVRMPPREFGKPLKDSEIAVLKRWISEGAPFAKHWSYVRPQREEIPVVPEPFTHWPRNAIDRFALQQMIRMGLNPSAEADAPALVRRVFLDLTGVPPTPDECDAWSSRLTVNGSDRHSDVVYEELVDHLLHRPEYGEHWARKWLDLARYADSSGYADDPARTIWPWRDWTIRAINSGMPFDQFTIEQLAGDLLPDATEDQLIATAFHRNTMTNNEGGTQDEEFRNVAVVDRVNTTMAVWMGTTITCAQCHTHKYDPISQDEYFQIFAILNNTEDADRGDDSPRLPLFTAEQKQRRSVLEARLRELDRLIATPSESLAAAQREWDHRLQHVPDWQTVRPTRIVRSSTSDGQIEEDGTIFVTAAADKDVYVIDIPGTVLPASAAALQIETLPSEQLPGKGAGHGGGNFVITELRLQVTASGESSPAARYLRIEIPGENRILSLAEVQVFSNEKNVALSGKASQSSTDFAGPAEYAIDGNTDGQYEKKSVTHTAISTDPWWELELTEDTVVDKVVLWNRAGASLYQRLSNFRITLMNAAREVIWTSDVADPPNLSAEYFPGSRRDVAIAAAVADFEQDGFSASGIFDGKTEPLNGWAVGGRVSDPHFLTVVPQRPLSLQADETLQLVVEQNSPYANHLLGRFRIRVTQDAAVLDRASLPADILAVSDRPETDRSPADREKLADYFRQHVAGELDAARTERRAVRTELADMKPETSVPIMRELTGGARRTTRFQFRGNYLDTGHEVKEGVPAVFPPIPDGQPIGRLTFAQWLVSDDNPLTGRVVANRYWENLFGRGIVSTSEDFGSQGDLPTHPELLDWLACELMESGWDTRAFLKLLVMSSTYRQSAAVTGEAAALDPENRWLARGPRVRLSAEMVRDQALQAAGLLSRKMYGPPVKPPQPSMGLSAAFGSSTDWQTSAGEDRFRRAIYTTWRRSNPYPSMATFDAPNREVCTLKRNSTNTPLQALVTMNDPVYVEAAQALARAMLAHSDHLKDQLVHGFRRCVLRVPRDSELASLEILYTDAIQDFTNDRDAAAKLATDPLGPLPEGMDPAEAAAMTVVGNVLLNLDEMFLKR